MKFFNIICEFENFGVGAGMGPRTESYWGRDDGHQTLYGLAWMPHSI